MARKRMFSREITDSDAFSDMPLSSQALYFHLSMSADDDGFINNPKKIQRSIGASSDDLSILVAKGFVIAFESGVAVIKHWHINNNIRNDRKVCTKYDDEISELVLKSNGAYSLRSADQAGWQMPGKCLANDGQMTGKCLRSIVENSIVEDSIDTLSGRPDDSSLCKEVVSYLNERIGTSYKPTTKKTATLIAARSKEGFGLDDFKAVIDRKASDWLGDSRMGRYLRPETLFGTKFESYLQESKAVSANARYAAYD